MWITTKKGRMKVVDSDALDIGRVIKPGDEITYLCKYNEKISVKATVVETYRYFARVIKKDTADTEMDTANWWDITGHNGKNGFFVVYQELNALEE